MSNISVTNTNGGSGSVDAIQYIRGDDAVAVPPNPATFIMELQGDTAQGVVTSGNAVTYTETISMLDATELQKGVILLASNAETIAGADTTKATTPDDITAKLGVQTVNGIPYGTGTAAAIAWLAEAANGQIPIGSTGNPPVLANITSSDGTVTITNGPGTIDLSASTTKGNGSTVGAVTDDLITIDLGMVAGTFQLEATVKGFESTTPAGCGYKVFGTFTTDGVAATFVGDEPIFNEDAALVDADAYFIASGNNAVLQVLGVVGLTITWNATLTKF